MTKRSLLSTLVTLLLAAFVFASVGAVAQPSTSSTPPTTLRTLYGLAEPDRLNQASTALVLVDFQDEFMHGRLQLPDVASATARATELLTWARQRGVLVVHVRNVVARKDSPIFAPDSPGAAPLPALSPTPREVVVVKSSGGGFTKTNLDAVLASHHVDTVIVAGLMTHLAVHLTAADASALGYRVIVAGDACASRDLPRAMGGTAGAVIDHKTIHDAALASIADRFAAVMTTDRIRALPVHQMP